MVKKVLRSKLPGYFSSCETKIHSLTMHYEHQIHLFVKALMLCHERFLHVVAAELVAAHRAKGDAAGGGGGIHRINASSVEAAMQELGMGDLLQQAQQSLLQRAGSSCHTKKASKRQRKTKSRQFTEEQIEEQERLLASSKSKVVKH